MDGGIEWFHDSFGFPPAGRPAVKRNDINVIFDLKSVQLAQPDLPESGLLDPVFGARYQWAERPTAWNLVIEGAVKVPVAGERAFLSTGHWDFGTQITLQRFMQRHAAYASLAAVHTRASSIATAARNRIAATRVRRTACPDFRSCNDKNAGRERPVAPKPVNATQESIWQRKN